MTRTAKEAILLVGGQGTRLRPLTINTPKPMLPVAGVPFTVHQILRARDAGIERIVLGTSYRADVFKEFIAGANLGIEVVIATEPEPLGTGGAIRFAADHLMSAPSDPVVIFNGDVLTGVDIAGLVAQHVANDAEVSLYLTRVDDPRAYGLVPTDGNGRVMAFLEKPTTPEEIVTDQINAGCYVFNRSVIDQIPHGQVVSVERETFPGLLTANAVVLGVVDDGYWLDLGTPLSFVAGSCDLVRGHAPSPAVPLNGESLIAVDAFVDGDADITGGTTIGSQATVGAASTVHASVVFDGATIGERCDISNSIIGERAVIGDDVTLDGVVVGDGAIIDAHNELVNGARVWPGAHLEATSVRFSSDR